MLCAVAVVKVARRHSVPPCAILCGTAYASDQRLQSSSVALSSVLALGERK